MSVYWVVTIYALSVVLTLASELMLSNISGEEPELLASFLCPWTWVTYLLTVLRGVVLATVKSIVRMMVPRRAYSRSDETGPIILNPPHELPRELRYCSCSCAGCAAAHGE